MRSRAALADAGEVRLVEVQVVRAHAHELRHPHAGGVQQLQHRAIPEATRSRDVRLRQQGVHLLDREERGKRGPGPRRPQILGGVANDRAVQQEVAVEAADGGHGSGHGARGEAGRPELAHERFEIGALERLERALLRRSVPRQRAQVARVALERVRREAPLDAQVIQERVDHSSPDRLVDTTRLL